MSAFQEKDRKYFFGREKFVDSLSQTTYKQPLVIVIGSSGSGKSSAVFAGLIPRLRAKGIWLIDSFRPQNQPFYELASVLVHQLEPELGKTDRVIKAKKLTKSIQEDGFTEVISEILKGHPEKHLLLVVDQFEEIYTLCQNTIERQQFVNILLTAVRSASRRLTLVLTLRADFYSQILNYPSFGEALEKYPPLPLRAMKLDEMQQAIEAPAREKYLELEPKLTQRILNDITREAGSLPLLEFALTELWKKQIGGKLTHQAYTEIGGVAKALANHAEEIYSKFSKAEQKQIQQIFVQLVRPGNGTEDTRRLATREEIKNWELVTYLAGEEARLIVTRRNEQTKQETVEIIHEALIREWKRLDEWMKSDRSFRNWQEGLRFAMHQWQKNNNDEEVLLRGTPLDEAENWLQQRSDEISELEWEFIQSSLVLRDRLLKQEKERQQQEIRSLKRLLEAKKKALKQEKNARIFTCLIAVSLFLLVCVSSFAWKQQKEAWEKFRLFLLRIQPPDKHLLNNLPVFIKEADELTQTKIEENVDLALAYYRNILENCPRLRQNIKNNPQNFPPEAMESIKKIEIKTENSLVSTIQKFRLPKLEKELKSNQFGTLKVFRGENGNQAQDITLAEECEHKQTKNSDLKERCKYIKVTDFEEQYTEGALKTTYKILMRDYGVRADLNGNGKVDNGDEAEYIPCKLVTDIETLWRQATNKNCGWNSKNCKYFNSKDLTPAIFPQPTNAVDTRINNCLKVNQ